MINHLSGVLLSHPKGALHSKTTGGKGGKGGNLESLGNGALSNDGAKRRKPAETGGNPLQELCSRNRPEFYCLTQGVQSKP